MLALIFLFFSASAITPCDHWMNRDLPYPDDIPTYLGTDYYNGGLLMEMFGPNKNKIRDFLAWLEHPTPAAAPEGLGMFHSSRGLVIAKPEEYPITAGLSEFGFSGDNQGSRALLEFYHQELWNVWGTKKAGSVARDHVRSLIDTELFGLYGTLERDTYYNLVRRAISGNHILDASIYPGTRYRAVDDCMFGRKSKLTCPLDDFDHVAEVIKQDDELVIVKVKLGARPQNRNQEVLQQMFFITHWQMVQKSYRETRLFTDSFDTAVYLLDDFMHSTSEMHSDSDIYLLYDAQAWDSMMFRLYVANKYVSIHMSGLGQQPYFYQRIADIFYPFYPSYGLIVSALADGSYEFKRLFHNDNPDPLNRLRTPPEVRKVSSLFYHEVAGQLPFGAKIALDAKTLAHVRRYERLGFHLTHEEFYPDWNSQKYRLIGDRETLLARTR